MDHKVTQSISLSQGHHGEDQEDQDADSPHGQVLQRGGVSLILWQVLLILSIQEKWEIKVQTFVISNCKNGKKM